MSCRVGVALFYSFSIVNRESTLVYLKLKCTAFHSFYTTVARTCQTSFPSLTHVVIVALPVLISNTERILDVRGKTAWASTGGRVTVLPPCAMAADATAVTRGVTSFLSRPAPLKLMQGIRFAIVYKQYISAVISFCFLIWMFKIIWEGMERHNRAMRMLKGAFVKFAKGGEALYQFLMTKSTLDTQLSMMHENATKMKRFVSEKIDGDARKKYLDGVKAFRVQVATGTKNKVANIAQRANSARKELINKARDIRGHFNKILPEAKIVLQTIAGGEFLKFKDEVGKFALSTIENKMDETFNAIQSAGKKIVPSTGHIITKKIEDDRGDDEVDELHQERATELDSEIGKIARRLLRFWTVLKGDRIQI